MSLACSTWRGQDVAGFETYAGRIAVLYEGDREALEDVVDGLFAIAGADGAVHEAELIYLERVSEIFSIDRAAFEQDLGAPRHSGRGRSLPDPRRRPVARFRRDQGALSAFSLPRTIPTGCSRGAFRRRRRRSRMSGWR